MDNTMKIRKSITKDISLTLVLIVGLPMLFSIGLSFYNIKYANIPLHAAFEVSGGLIAIIISTLFFIKFSKNHILTHFNYLSLALFVMGSIDIFHGLMMPGKLFVWLHSTAVLFGGLLFTTIWFKHKQVSKTTYKLLPSLAVILSASFSLLSIFFSQFIPEMLDQHASFTFTANLFNIIGGLGFFIASIKFFREYIKTNEREELFFAGHSLLFGISGILFVSSSIWDLQWWLWHLLRFSAYFIALYFVYVEFNAKVTYMELSNMQLSQANQQIKNYLSILDKNVITSSTDLHGNITNASQAFCNISGYDESELIGQNYRMIQSSELFNPLYKKIDHVLKQNKSWEGEVRNKTKKGSYYWTVETINPIFDEHGIKTGYTTVSHNITEQKHMETLSNTDALTNIYNRRHFNELFPRMLNISKRENKLVSFIMLDIDHFKQYNDIYGHQMGDDVLVKVAQTLKNSLKRADDYCFRIGGEEFGIIFNVDEQHKALEYANVIKNKIESLQIEHKGNSTTPYVTVSMGLVCKAANLVKDIDEIYNEGDQFLYKAKENGRNSVMSNLD